MGSVVIMGAGPSGLAAGILWAEAGLDVTVVDKDQGSLPDNPATAWEQWHRPGVAQFRQAHTLQPRGAEMLRELWPGVFSEMERLGAYQFNTLYPMPPTLTERLARPDDGRFFSLGARRPTYELAFARVAQEVPGLTIMRGQTVTGLRTGPEVIPGTPHVTGVVTDGGELIGADLVVDAMGRRSPLPALLEHVGARTVNEVGQDSRFVYYSQFFRKRDGGEFPQPYTISLFPAGSISILTLPGDNDTWSVTLYSTTSDKAIRAVRNGEIFQRVVRAFPTRAGWVDGNAITDVDVMAGISDRERSLVVDGSAVVTGVVSIADAWACTNPSLGRGISMALMHIASVTPGLMASLDQPAELAATWHQVTRDDLQPWHRTTLELDGARNKEMNAIRKGESDPSRNASAFAGGKSSQDAAFFAAAMTDGSVFRALLEMLGLFALPQEVMARPEVQTKVGAVGTDLSDIPQPPVLSRAKLEELLS